MKLRKLAEEDIPFCVQLRKEALWPYVSNSTTWHEDSEFKAMSRKVRLGTDDILEICGEKVGLFAVHYNKDHILLGMIAILPKYQKQGIGKKLLDFIKNEAMQKRVAIKLGVHPENSKALNFYIKNGFTYTDEPYKRESSANREMIWKG